MLRKALSLGVFKFSSCDGCQLSLLDCEEQLLTLASALNIKLFYEAKRDFEAGPYDIALVEGSISTEGEVLRAKAIREEAGLYISFGVCATEGGVQALRNRGDFKAMMSYVYPTGEIPGALPTSRPHHDVVKVDFELPGCPPNRFQLLEMLTQVLLGRKPSLPTYSVCVECKRMNNVCVLVARNLPCMGPVTQDGCGALCPSYDRDCYACFGPMDDPKPVSFAEELRLRGLTPEEVDLRFRKITPATFEEAFEKDRAWEKNGSTSRTSDASKAKAASISSSGTAR
jgi:sulfhydrogenase subunit delta